MLTPLYLMTFYFKLVMWDRYFQLLRILKSAILMMELILWYYEYQVNNGRNSAVWNFVKLKIIQGISLPETAHFVP